MMFSLKGAVTKFQNQGTCLVETPEPLEAGKDYPFVVAVHGSNRCSIDYLETPFYSRQREIALENGCIFGVISNGYDTWGTDDGLYNLKLFIEHIKKSYPVKSKAILWATSAGGVLASRLVNEYGELVDRVIGTFPVYDLESTYPLQTCRVAWRAKSIEQFKEAIEGKNPPTFVDGLKNTKYYITHGDSDSAVPLEANSARLKTESGDNVFLQIIRGGVHSTGNFDFYGEAVRRAFSE